jgi:hypothetical protein
VEPNFQRYLDWYRLRDVRDQVPGSTLKLISRLEELIISTGGRLQIAKALLVPAKKKLERLREVPSQKDLKKLIIELENFIEILPDDERFNPAVMSIRKILFDLCSILTSRYGVVGSTDTYEGPRPTRFERLIGTDNEEVSSATDDGSIIQALL